MTDTYRDQRQMGYVLRLWEFDAAQAQLEPTLHTDLYRSYWLMVKTFAVAFEASDDDTLNALYQTIRHLPAAQAWEAALKASTATFDALEVWWKGWLAAQPKPTEPADFLADGARPSS